MYGYYKWLNACIENDFKQKMNLWIEFNDATLRISSLLCVCVKDVRISQVEFDSTLKLTQFLIESKTEPKLVTMRSGIEKLQ